MANAGKKATMVARAERTLRIHNKIAMFSHELGASRALSLYRSKMM